MLIHRAARLALPLLIAIAVTSRGGAAQGTTPAPAPAPATPPTTTPAGAPEQGVQVTFIPEGRLDLLSSPTAVHAGVGFTVPLSNYFRLGADVAGGVSSDGFSARADGFGRFSLDPYHEFPWEPYVGGGVTVRGDAGGRGTRTYLLALIGVNGPAAGGIVPGLEFGIGGGLRFGVVLRRATPDAPVRR